MNVFPKSRLPLAEVRKFICIFYTVAFLGFSSSLSRDLFEAIIPLALIVNVYLLAVYHSKFSLKDVAAFSIVGVSGFCIEAAGVNTGTIFGAYQYGPALGPKLFNTPLIIALNWVFLAYTASSLAGLISHKPSLQMVLTPSLMVLYDLVLEQAAQLLHMWNWENSVVPASNYIAWWIIGFLFTCLLKLFRVETKNPLAILLICAQFVFFALLIVAL